MRINSTSSVNINVKAKLPKPNKTALQAAENSKSAGSSITDAMTAKLATIIAPIFSGAIASPIATITPICAVGIAGTMGYDAFGKSDDKNADNKNENNSENKETGF